MKGCIGARKCACKRCGLSSYSGHDGCGLSTEAEEKQTGEFKLDEANRRSELFKCYSMT